jgi:hypothetical protein
MGRKILTVRFDFTIKKKSKFIFFLSKGFKKNQEFFIDLNKPVY